MRYTLRLAVLLCLALTPGNTRAESGVAFSQEEIRKILQHSPLPPLPADPSNDAADSVAAARLGQLLFFDPSLSVAGDITCASCHDPKQGWSNGEEVVEVLVLVLDDDLHDMFPPYGT